jgi:cardiolipin synthase
LARGEPLPIEDEVPVVEPGDETVQVVRGQPGRFVSDVALLLRALLDAAEERIWVATAYFVPEDEVTERLLAAVDRGVDVHLLVPGEHNDKRVSRLAARAAMDPLLDAGVRIEEYQRTMLHCKVVITDQVAVAGSANLNMRSLHQDDEIVTVLHGEDSVGTLAEHFEQDLRDATAMEPGRFEERSLGHRIEEGTVNLLRRFL